MHPKSKHHEPYDFLALCAAHKPLKNYVFTNAYGTRTIDFSEPRAVLELNRAILKNDYGLHAWSIPNGYLCPPIPGRADYIHHIADLLRKSGARVPIKGLDVGMGANCIYPILGVRIYEWQMVGCDIEEGAITAAQKTISDNMPLLDTVEIRHQKDNANLFGGIIKADEFFHFTMCNPPFYASATEARQKTQQKQRKLGLSSQHNRNFAGEAHELWCNGGEALFLKRMIKESADFSQNVGLFSSLVSNRQHLPKIIKQLDKLGAAHEIIVMEQGNKKSRIVTWKF